MDSIKSENNAYSVVVVATDEVGNESSQTVTVDVTDVDDFKPVITGPSEKLVMQ